jgi:AcrR family transcriptional regulator
MAKGIRRRGYHHGNLREALVAAARRLIAERGPAGFTLIEAARLAGVSAAAPYRHFKDREALLADVARRGFEEFAARLAAAWEGAEHDPEAAFLRMGEAYLAFAREEPGYYSAMFVAVPTATLKRHPRKGNAFAALENAVAEVTSGRGKKLDARRIAYQVWALSHGLATLAAAGQLPAGDARLTAAALLREGVGALIAGADGGGARRRSAADVPRPPPRAKVSRGKRIPSRRRER